MRAPRTILITGASNGIGAALALEYAVGGRLLLLHGRSEERLARIADLCRRRGAEVRTKALDLRDTDALLRWLEGVAADVDLAIVNAGVTSSVPDGESWARVDEVLQVNLRAALATASAFVPHMRRRGAGQIALISSLAAWYGLPLTPAYSASKAALKAYGEGLRGWLAPQGVEVNVVLPGYVRTEMSRRIPGPKPFMIEPEDAARRIALGLACNRARISFPFPLNLGTWLLSVLPSPVSQRLLRALGYGGGG